MKGRRILNRRLRAVRKELNAVRSDIKAAEHGRPVRHRATPPRESTRPLPPRPATAPVLVSPGPPDSTAIDAMAAHAPTLPTDAATARAEEDAIRKRAASLRDERFTDYLASSVQGLGPMRHERAIQRNKAIVMAIVVVVLALWLVSKFWM